MRISDWSSDVCSSDLMGCAAVANYVSILEPLRSLVLRGAAAMGNAMNSRVMNLGRLLSDTARRLPEHTALVWGDRRWTWGQTAARVDALVAALRDRGLGKGDAILVQAKNSNQMFESLWAAFTLGAIGVPARKSP